MFFTLRIEVAVGNGIDYEKVLKTPVVDERQLPDGYSNADFRDPKVWGDGNKFYMAVGNKNQDQVVMVEWGFRKFLKHGRRLMTVITSNSTTGSFRLKAACSYKNSFMIYNQAGGCL